MFGIGNLDCHFTEWLIGYPHFLAGKLVAESNGQTQVLKASNRTLKLDFVQNFLKTIGAGAVLYQSFKFMDSELKWKQGGLFTILLALTLASGYYYKKSEDVLEELGRDLDYLEQLDNGVEDVNLDTENAKQFLINNFDLIEL